MSKNLFRKLSVLLLAMPTIVWSSEGVVNGADTVWIIVATTLVLMMTLPGLAFFYSGLVRAKNSLSVFMQCIAAVGLVSVLWVLVGYSLSFGDGGAFNSWLGGTEHFALAGIGSQSVTGTIPEVVFVIFQMTFAFITPALIVGGFAERMKFSSILLFLLAWELLVYFPICHWVWGGGWLAEMGFVDFAGGAVVHINAGVAALVAAMMVGSRMGFAKVPFPPHSLILTMAGASLLWVGWYGFNGGSALTAGHDAGMAILVTHLSACVGALVWAGIEWVRFGTPTALGVATGLIAGLAAITPAAGVVGPMGALLIGLASGLVCYTVTSWLKNRMKVDDSLDVFAVHGVGGTIGLILLSFLGTATFGGFGDFSIGSQLTTQLIGIAATTLWSVIVSALILWVLHKTIGLRVEAGDEKIGLDLSTHGEKGYNQ